VDTQVTFANQLVSFLTLGIYSPMAIKVTCASPRAGDDGAEEVIQVGADGATPEEAMSEAARRVRAFGQPVLVRF
jgi:hypothetical protein